MNEKIKELLEAAMGDEGDMIYCFEVNEYIGEIPQSNEAKRIELIRLALILDLAIANTSQDKNSKIIIQECAECGSRDIEIIVEMDINFCIGNHKPCLVPLWKCKECGFKYFNDILGEAASKIIIANEHL